MNDEIKISDEARECAHREILTWNEEGPMGHHVQLLLNKHDAEIAELRKDKKRLDFLAEGRRGVWFNGRAIHWSVQDDQQTVGNIGSDADIRKALDAAMSNETKGE